MDEGVEGGAERGPAQSGGEDGDGGRLDLCFVQLGEVDAGEDGAGPAESGDEGRGVLLHGDEADEQAVGDGDEGEGEGEHTPAGERAEAEDAQAGERDDVGDEEHGTGVGEGAAVIGEAAQEGCEEERDDEQADVVGGAAAREHPGDGGGERGQEVVEQVAGVRGEAGDGDGSQHRPEVQDARVARRWVGHATALDGAKRRVTWRIRSRTICAVSARHWTAPCRNLR